MLAFDLVFLSLRAAELLEDESALVASLEFETFKLLFLQGDLSFSLLGRGDWASVKYFTI